jgi:hypothetical protein
VAGDRIGGDHEIISADRELAIGGPRHWRLPDPLGFDRGCGFPGVSSEPRARLHCAAAREGLHGRRGLETAAECVTIDSGNLADVDDEHLAAFPGVRGVDADGALVAAEPRMGVHSPFAFVFGR